jgi:chromosome partitioning protein
MGDAAKQYDTVLIDCPPALGPVTVNALVAADRVIVPVQAEYLALEGLVEFLDTLSTVRREMNPSLELAGVVVTMHDERTRLAQDVERELREHFSEIVFRTVIPRTVRIAEAPSYGIPVTEYAPGSRGAQAYLALAEEVDLRG